MMIVKNIWIGVLFILILSNMVSASGASDLGVANNVKEFKLDNGLKVIVKENHSAPVFTAQLWFKVGALDEPLHLSGSAHLIEHMLFRSTKHFKAGEISKTLRGYGGVDNAATSYDYTYYWVLLNPKYLDFAIQIMAERFEALFLEDELKKETGVVLSELQGYENSPSNQLFNSLSAASYDVSAYKRPVIGYREDLEKVKRDNLYKFYKTYYVPENATLVLAGDITEKEALKYVKEHFGRIKHGNLPERNYYIEPVQKGKKVVDVDIAGETSMVYMSYHVPDIKNKDIDALTVLGEILSNGKTGRLYQNMVENGSCVNAFGEPFSRKMPSMFVFGAIGNPGVTEDVLIDELIAEIEKIKITSITDEEFNRAINQTRADIIFENDSVSGQGHALGVCEVYGDWRDYDLAIARIESVTKEDIIRVANKYFVNSNLTIARSNRVKENNFVTVPCDTFKKVEYKDLDKTSNSSVTDNKEIKPHRKVLDNGIVVLVQENHSNPTVALEGYFEAGDMYESRDMPGVSKLTANMLMRGTKTRSSLDIAKSLEDVGASLEFGVSAEKTDFAGKALSMNLDVLINNLSDCILNPSFPDDQIEKLRNEVVSNISYNKLIPRNVANQTFFNQVVGKDTPFYLASFDDMMDYANKFKKEDLIDFHKKYRPDNMVIAVAGDVNPEEVFNTVEQYFKDFKAVGEKPVIANPIYEKSTDLKVIKVPMEDKAESYVVYGYPVNTSRMGEDFYKFRIANQILGGGGALNSMLGNEIRENKGLVYGIYSSASGVALNGIWCVSFGTAPQHVDEALTAVYDIMDKFVKNKVTESEVNDTKNFVLGMFSQGLETNEGCATILTQIEYSNLGLDYFHTINDKYKDITANDVLEMAQKYIYPKKGVLVICGPENK